jgi:hypothetical protein
MRLLCRKSPDRRLGKRCTRMGTNDGACGGAAQDTGLYMASSDVGKDPELSSDLFGMMEIDETFLEMLRCHAGFLELGFGLVHFSQQCFLRIAPRP